MVMDEDAKKSREAAQTAVEDIPALDFQSIVENAEEPNCAAQNAIEEILEISIEEKAEYAEEPAGLPEDARVDTPEDAAVDVKNTESASPVVPGPSKQGCWGLLGGHFHTHGTEPPAWVMGTNKVCTTLHG